jgi:hypothetical protein
LTKIQVNEAAHAQFSAFIAFYKEGTAALQFLSGFGR